MIEKIKETIKGMDLLLTGIFLSTLFYGATYPYIYSYMLSHGVNDKLIATDSLVSCCSMIIFQKVWDKFSDKIYKIFIPLLIAEVAYNVINIVIYVMYPSVIVYYLIDLGMACTVSRNVINCHIKIKSLKYNTSEKRVTFDMTYNSVYAVATIIASLIALVINLSFVQLLIIGCIGIVISNIFDAIVYLQLLKEK